ncbi:MAG: hypothetical protein AABX72_02080 [Nanoarchaeota archaeon]
MGDMYYLCKLPAEKQHFRNRIPFTQYYGIHFEEQDGTPYVKNVITKEELSKIGVAALNHQAMGVVIVTEVPGRPDILRGKRNLSDHLRITVDGLAQHHQDLEILSMEDLRKAGIENIVERVIE